MFCVIYRWRLKPGHDDDFVAAWARLTRAIRDGRGGLGSRLHRSDDGLWVERKFIQEKTSKGSAGPGRMPVLGST